MIIIFSNIAVILLNESMMIYFQFKISIDINFDFIYNISTQSHLIELIWETKLIFWDETSMQHRYIFEVIDCIFKNIHNNSQSFENIIFYFYNNFHQILSIVPRETYGQIISTSLKYFSFWYYIQCLFLIMNIYLFSS